MDESLRCQGMRDIPPERMRRFRRVEDAFRAACHGWGYREVRTPVLERLHLFTSAGTLSPQMLGRVYSFLDWDGWSGERVVLRPDSTIPVARLYAESADLAAPAKLFYVQNVFRFAQGDQSREDWQCGVELMGEAGPEGDVGLIVLAREVLERLGLPPAVRISHPGIVRAVLAAAGLDAAGQLAMYDRILDEDNSALDELQGRLPRAAASLSGLLTIDGEGEAYLSNLRAALLAQVPDVEQPLDEIAVVASALEGMGWRCLISPVLVRDFEYYTGVAFQFEVEGHRVGGGGRYDALISLVSGRQVPASGFALNAEALAELLAEEPASLSAITVAAGDGLVGAFMLASALRREGLTVEVAAAPPSDGVSVRAAGEGYELIEGGAKRSVATVGELVRALRERGS